MLLETCSPPQRIAMLTYADFRDEAQREGQFARLVDALRGKLGLAEIGPRLRELLPPEAALHTLRAPVGDFIGRAAEVEELVGYLSRDGGTATITGIHGMGGIGKTELALVVAHKLAGQYPDAALQFELQPDGVSLSSEALLAAVIDALQTEGKLPEGLAELQGAYRAALAGKRGLLLLDNAAGPGAGAAVAAGAGGVGGGGDVAQPVQAAGGQAIRPGVIAAGGRGGAVAPCAV